MGSLTPRGSPTSHQNDACDIAFDRSESLGTPDHRLLRCSIALPIHAATDASPAPSREPTHGSRRNVVRLLLRSGGLAPPTFCQFAWRTRSWPPFLRSACSSRQWTACKNVSSTQMSRSTSASNDKLSGAFTQPVSWPAARGSNSTATFSMFRCDVSTLSTKSVPTIRMPNSLEGNRLCQRWSRGILTDIFQIELWNYLSNFRAPRKMTRLA